MLSLQNQIMTKYLLVLTVLLWISKGLSAQNNLIQNGQFINGTKGWNVLLTDKDQPIKAQIEHGDSYKDYGLADNFVGTNFVELDAQSAIQQTLATEPEQRYKLIFAYAPRPDAGKNQLIVMANGKVIHTQTLESSSGTSKFMYKEIAFVAASSKTKLSFYAVSINNSIADKGILITDIWCAPLTEDVLKLNAGEHKF